MRGPASLGFPAAGEPDLMLQPGMLDRYDELFMAVAEQTGLIAEKRKKFLLKIPPPQRSFILSCKDIGHNSVILWLCRLQDTTDGRFPITPNPFDFSVFSQKTRCAAQF